MYRIVLNETSYYGAGCRSVIAEEVRKRGFRKALLVTDKDLIRFGVAEKIERVLADAGIPYEIYSEIKANPTIRNVQQGVEAFKRSGADFMVALGGGSSIDTAKAVGIIVNNPEFADVRSLEGTAATKHRAVPTFAVPTTAGTAAEVTINYVITDEEAKRKMVCVDPNDIPMCAVIDCELMYSMPKGLTAATGMDALTHAVEGYLTPGAWTMSDMFELKAIELIARHLKTPSTTAATRRPVRAWPRRSISPAWAFRMWGWASSTRWLTRWEPSTTRRTAWPTPRCCPTSWSTTPSRRRVQNTSISPAPWA